MSALKLLLVCTAFLLCVHRDLSGIVVKYNWTYEFSSEEKVFGSFLGEVGGNYDLYRYNYDTGTTPNFSLITLLGNAFFSLYLGDGSFVGSVSADDGLLAPGIFAPQTIPKNGDYDGLNIDFTRDTNGIGLMSFVSSPLGTTVALFCGLDADPERIESYRVSEVGNAGWRLLNPEIVSDTGSSLLLFGFAFAALGLSARFVKAT